MKKALVTGAARRIGRAISLRLASEGFAIAVHYNQSHEDAASLVGEIRGMGGSAERFCADLSESDAAERLADDVWQCFGPLDLLVNNASLWTPTPIDTLTARQFDDQLAINLRSPFLLASRLGLLMKRTDGGLIINLLDWSIDRPYKDYVPYGIAKAGLAAATRGLARALAPEVRVNALAPGPILLPDRIASDQAEQIRRAIPLGRIGDPSDLTEAVVYLLRADYITGAILPIDGGRSIR